MKQQRHYGISVFIAILLHAALLALLLWNVSFSSTVKVAGNQGTEAPEPKIVEAKAVSAEKLQAEINRLNQQDEDRRRAEEARQTALRRKAEAAEQKRKSEEAKIAAAKQQQQAINEKSAALARELKAAETARQQQEKAEAARLARLKETTAAEEKRLRALQAKAEQAKATEAKKKQLADKATREQALQQQLQADQPPTPAPAGQAVVGNADKYMTLIHQKVTQRFNWTGARNLLCVLTVNVAPGGSVTSVSVAQSGGNEAYCQAAQQAVLSASPLPVPTDPLAFKTFQRFNFTMRLDG